jgi:hypothetical protein
MKLITEKKMVKKFLSNEKNQYCNRYVEEVPVFAKSIDLVRIDLHNNYITAIEFKTTKWRKAIDQVLGAAIAFDFLEICVLRPRTEKCQESIMDTCKDYGIGLFFIDPIAYIIEHKIEPIHCNGVWERQRLQILQYLNGRLK